MDKRPQVGSFVASAFGIKQPRTELKEHYHMDGLIINYLWEKINEGLFENWRPFIFYFLESRTIEENNGVEEEHKTALTTKHLADHFKWSPQSIRKAIGSLGIVEKGLSSSMKVDGRTQRVIFFAPRRLEKRLRGFVVNYTPNTVTQVTGVTVSKCGTQKEQKGSLFSFTEKTDTPHIKTVTSVTPVTEQPYFNQCYFCGEPIYEADAVTNKFTENKPAHIACYERKFGRTKSTN